MNSRATVRAARNRASVDPDRNEPRTSPKGRTITAGIHYGDTFNIVAARSAPVGRWARYSRTSRGACVAPN